MFVLRLLVFAAAAAALSACTTAADVERARQARYKADFVHVYTNVLEAVRDLFPDQPAAISENPGRRSIETVWKEVSINQSSTLNTNNQQPGQNGQNPQNQQGGLNRNQNGAGTGFNQGMATLQRRRFFIRYKIRIAGENPWRVEIQGFAQQWELGDAKPVALTGATEPHWLRGRVSSLYVDINERLKKYAIYPKKLAKRPSPSDLVKVDRSRFGSIPKDAVDIVEQVYRAAKTRDSDKLRTLMTDDFEWSLGAEPSADQAIVMWGANTNTMPSLVTTLDSGCASTAPTRVVCPVACSQEPNYSGYRVGFERKGDEWLMTFFLSGN